MKGPYAGDWTYIFDVAWAGGVDASVALQTTELYFNGKTDDIKLSTFLGFRLGLDLAVTVLGVDFGKSFLFTPGKNGLFDQAVFGIGASVGFGIPELPVSGNFNVGYTSDYKRQNKEWREFIKKISVKK
ncbi:MAG: hypothetical protein CVT96_09590 [Bacteroidetes bacterium HGW-Bacteroidetes-13]|nr:MAG: hypothetical protein CVT96_09590 [Bacteroidetes bacterium HGW-Bacteroidetes-13]